MKEILRRTWAEIDLDALARNYEQVRKCMDPKAKLCCVVKADAYGHGAVRMVQEFELLGADWFAVSNLEEALQLRLAGIRKPVLILGYTPAEEAASLAKYEISQCVYSTEYAKELSNCAQTAGCTVKIHVKIDTGMSRLGFYFQDINRDAGAVEEVKAVCGLPGLYPEGIFTHFAKSDEEDKTFTKEQLEKYLWMKEELKKRNVTFTYYHCSNSAGIIDLEEANMDIVRAGITTYGMYPVSYTHLTLPTNREV